MKLIGLEKAGYPLFNLNQDCLPDCEEVKAAIPYADYGNNELLLFEAARRLGIEGNDSRSRIDDKANGTSRHRAVGTEMAGRIGLQDDRARGERRRQFGRIGRFADRRCATVERAGGIQLLQKTDRHQDQGGEEDEAQNHKEAICERSLSIDEKR